MTRYKAIAIEGEWRVMDFERIMATFHPRNQGNVSARRRAQEYAAWLESCRSGTITRQAAASPYAPA